MIRGITSGSPQNKSMKEILAMHEMSSGYTNCILLEPRSVIKNSGISEKYCTMPGGSTTRANCSWLINQ